MKKVIKLKESDLMKIVQRVLSEQSQPEEYYIGRATAMLAKGPKPTEPGLSLLHISEPTRRS